jgi:hypothetical protein
MIDFSIARRQQLKPFAAQVTGNPFASLVLVKGRPNAAEREGAAPFSGADGLALDKAVGRLGWGYGSRDTRVWFGILLPLAASDLRLLCEIVDPLAIVTLDEEARVALIDALGPDGEGAPARLAPGAQGQILGRRLTSVEGFEDALADEGAKQRAWAQLKRCAFPL